MVALCIAAMFTANAQIVRTTVTQGEIEGEEHDGYTLFKAIPYAEAPVGNLRWKKPVAKLLGKAYIRLSVGATVLGRLPTLIRAAVRSQ